MSPWTRRLVLSLSENMTHRFHLQIMTESFWRREGKPASESAYKMQTPPKRPNCTVQGEKATVMRKYFCDYFSWWPFCEGPNKWEQERSLVFWRLFRKQELFYSVAQPSEPGILVSTFVQEADLCQLQILLVWIVNIYFVKRMLCCKY